MKTIALFRFAAYFSLGFLLVAGNAGCQDATKLPEPAENTYVTDLIGLFTPKQNQRLDSMIRAFEERTGAQIALLAVDTTYFEKENLNEFSLEVFNHWGIGKKENNNGVLVLVCPGYQNMRIENGLGIEKILSNQETAAIIDVFLPFFKENRYFEGCRQGLQLLILQLEPRLKQQDQS